mmetsp:Transcript_130730/g.279596  ORF Transcript_130730/g.279596 Transcript_130730/m.279596 type:complete len:208 (+) Transcript_130730:747-1370(+)
MEVLQGETDLGGVEASINLLEAPLGLSLEKIVKLTPTAILEDIVQLLRRLEGGTEFHDEGAPPLQGGNADVALHLRAFTCALVSEMAALMEEHLLHGLHGVVLAIACATDETHFAKAALADGFKHLEVVTGQAPCNCRVTAAGRSRAGAGGAAPPGAHHWSLGVRAAAAARDLRVARYAARGGRRRDRPASVFHHLPGDCAVVLATA